jgi:hypothetical protein
MEETASRYERHLSALNKRSVVHSQQGGVRYFRGKKYIILRNVTQVVGLGRILGRAVVNTVMNLWVP